MSGKRICSVDGCDRVHKGHGYCRNHLRKWRRWGDPLGAPVSRAERGCSVGGCDREHFGLGKCKLHWEREKNGIPLDGPKRINNLDNYLVDPETGCWVWQGAVFSTGYGRTSVTVNGTQVAHRALFIEANGPIPDDMVLDHLCRNTLCVNDWHLDPVTSQENLRRGGNSYALRDKCRNGLHDITKPDAWYVTPRSGKRVCAACRTSARLRREAALKEAG